MSKQKQAEYTTLMEMSWQTATYVARSSDLIDINTKGNAFIVGTQGAGCPPNGTHPPAIRTISHVVDQCVSKVAAFSS